MAAFPHFPKDLLSSLSAEVLYIILSYLPAKSLLNVSECNRRLRDLCQNCNPLWKHLCKVRLFFRHAVSAFKGVFCVFDPLCQNIQLFSSSFNVEDLQTQLYNLLFLPNEENVRLLWACFCC